MKPLVLFAHGKESGPWGSKIKLLARIAEQRGAKVLSPDYSLLDDPDARVSYLLGLELIPHDGLVLVGSSMGGYVSTLAAATLKPDGLFLMAPAFYTSGYANQAPSCTVRHLSLVSGWNDDVIPVECSIRFAQAHHAELHLLDSDHRLNDVLDDLGALFDRFLGKVFSARAEPRDATLVEY